MIDGYTYINISSLKRLDIYIYDKISLVKVGLYAFCGCLLLIYVTNFQDIKEAPI